MKIQALEGKIRY